MLTPTERGPSPTEVGSRVPSRPQSSGCPDTESALACSCRVRQPQTSDAQIASDGAGRFWVLWSEHVGRDRRELRKLEAALLECRR